MKVKLLKKIRRRYSIDYYKEDFFIFGSWFKGGCYVITDRENEFRTDFKKSYSKSLETLMKWIRKDYRTDQRKIRNTVAVKHWHTSNSNQQTKQR